MIARPNAAPAVRDEPLAEQARIRLADGAVTTVHAARFPRRSTAVRVVRFQPPRRLAAWCAEAGVAYAIVGGFFIRPRGRPLGEVRVGGAAADHEPFSEPWTSLRACVSVNGNGLEIRPRRELGREPAGDLLQAGPLLVRDRASAVLADEDAEGFSAGAHQFDSDITGGRYPRAALGVSEDELIAVACDGRARDDAGMTLAELAEAMLGLGAHTAINLDGGGSTSLVFAGALLNVPREEHGVVILGGRPIATALAFSA
jgi:hypothetical protein